MTNSFPYIDDMFRRGAVRAPASMHIGYLDPRCDPLTGDGSKRERVKALDDLVLSDAMLGDGQRVLDIGCGLGGTLDAIARRHDSMDLIGLNIDPRQLVLCAKMVSDGSSTFRWCCGDAVRLPFATDSMDRVVTVEAAPHFSSRTGFLAEAARVLRPGGRLVGTDISLALPPGTTATVRASVLHDIERGVGTWPDPFADLESVYSAAEHLGFRQVRFEDISAATAIDTGNPAQPTTPVNAAIARIGSIHRAGELSCVRFAFDVIK